MHTSTPLFGAPLVWCLVSQRSVVAGACASTVLAGGLGLTWVVFVAWYDTDLKSYQKDRKTELECAFEEKIDSDYSLLHESKFGEYMAKPVDRTEETEWQKLAKKKNAGEKIKEVRHSPDWIVPFFILFVYSFHVILCFVSCLIQISKKKMIMD